MEVKLYTISVRLNCPFCGNVERMQVFAPLRMWESEKAGSSVVDSYDQAGFMVGATVCPECCSPMGVRVKKGPHMPMTALLSAKDSERVERGLSGGGWALPNPPALLQIEPDEALPTKIRETFVFIQEDANRRRNPAGILSSARGCLDVALKELGEPTGGRKKRIESLATKGIITKGIAEWAQTLWEEGNDAVHDLDASIDRAIEHVEFLKLFFEVAFALPSRIEKATHVDANEIGPEQT